MYSADQTLRHKITGKLARLNPKVQCPESCWAWNIGKRTSFIDEEGHSYFDDISHYTHIEDEFGRAIWQHSEGERPDMSLKKYMVGPRTLKKMRYASLKRLESELLAKMEKKKSIIAPFSDGSKNWVFHNWFMRRRKAFPLYHKYQDYTNKYVNGTMCFCYRGKWWIFDEKFGHLARIKPHFREVKE